MNREMRMRCALCLSARGDVPLQWSYYAAGHSDYALAFHSSVKLFLGASPVRYRDEFPKIVVDRAHEPGHALDETLLSKAKSWRHELEWRVFATRGHPGLDYIEPQPRTDVDGIYARLPAGALKALILGVRIWPADKCQVRRLAETADPQIGVIETKQTRYRFEIHLQTLP